MRLKKLLVLSALSLMGTSAWADVPENSWTMPEPTGLEYTTFTDDGTRYYLYNPAAKMFFASGNSWGTQASVRTFGYPFWLEPSAEADAPEGSYELWDDFSNSERGDVSGPHNLFTDDGGSTWVDHASQGNYSWSFTIVGEYVRFQNVALIADLPSYDGKYLGWAGDYDGSNYSSVLKMIDPDVEGTSVDWKAVTEDSYMAFVESDAYKAYTDGVACFFQAKQLHGLLVEAEGLSANISAELAAFTNLASTPAELEAAVEALKPIIEARKALKKTLDDAKAAGYTATEAYDAVYSNGDATVDELKKAQEDLNADLVEWGKGHASVEHPSDMSSKIVNPNFDNASSAGWSGTSPNMVGSGSHGPANVAETWNATFDMYQDIEGLPAGVYALGAQTMWRCHWVDMVNHVGPAAKLYAVIGESEVSTPFNYALAPMVTESPDGSNTSWGVNGGFTTDTDEETGTVYYIPNDPSGFRIFAEKGYYDTKVMFGVTEGASVRIGVKNPSMMGTWDNWSCYDTFTLTYYGAGADAGQLYLDETIKNYGEREIEEGTIFTESYLTAYNEALKQEISVSSFAEVATALGEIDAANSALDKNIELWKQWQDDCADAYQKYVLDEKYADFDAIYDLADYVDPNGEAYEEALDAHNWTNEELEAEIQKIADMVEALLQEVLNSTHYDGDDMTSFIKNPTFEKSNTANTGNSEGWTVDRVSGGNVTPGPIGGDGDTFLEKCGYYNGCFESWHCHDWDVWQEIQGLPRGMYELNVQGYVRCEVSGYTRGNDLTDYPSPVYLYMNSATAQFPNVYSQVPADYGVEFQTVESWTLESINDNNFPNSMGGAAQCFNNPELYKMTAYGLIAKKGDTFRIGVRMKADQDWWCIWDNFKLTYREPTVDVVKPILEEEIEKLDLSRPMGANVFEQASQVKAAAEEAIASNDGEKMFDALVAVYDLGEAINASVALFATLNDANESLSIKISSSKATDATKSEARTLSGNVTNGIENHTFTDDEVDGLLAEIKAMKTKLGIPANAADATDAAPVDMTATIENPDYDENTAGWSGTGAAWSGDGLNAEIFGKNFDYYQDIVGLPAGTYQVSVQGFYRAGSASVDYDTWTKNPEENNNAFLYACYINGTDTVTSSKPLTRLAAEASPIYLGSDGYVTLVEASDESEGLAVCNTMTTAGYEFMDGKYSNNSIIVKLETEGATLRIGLNKTIDLTDNWTIFDAWKLTYFGTNSSKTPDGDTNGIYTVNSKPAMVEFYNLSGARINKPAKGVAIVKRIYGDGTVKVQKVTVK